MLFAAQAATAIAPHARTEQRRARADLETLFETSPVGVVVFDGGTGKLLSFNRETRRIVEELGMPGQSASPCWKWSPAAAPTGRGRIPEFPMAQVMRSAETVRAEEMTLSVPDGRSVTTLVNATPIGRRTERSRRVVVTLQDLAPLKELERMRAEFLASSATNCGRH